MVKGLLSFLFGRGTLAETVEVFRPNAEASDQRASEVRQQAMAQFSQEFGQPGIINSVADGLNRMGRPIITYGVIFLFISAMYDPIWFSARMQGLSLVPEPLWFIFGAIVSFFFGARELSKIRSKNMAKEAARIAESVPGVIHTVQEISSLAPSIAETSLETNTLDGLDAPDDNPALATWRKLNGVS